MKQTIYCEVHGEVEGDFDEDLGGDVATVYCPKCLDENPDPIKIKRVDKSLPLPAFQTYGSVAFDIYTRVECEIRPRQIVLIPTNLIIQVPKGYMLMITLRSSAPRKYGLTMPHGAGIIDQDYCGEEDEIMLQVMGIVPAEYLVTLIPRGERIAQGIFIPIQRPAFASTLWEEVDSMAEVSRGGFGSTDE